MKLKDGYVAVVKEDCPTCRLVVPVLAQLVQGEMRLTVYSQDELAFLQPIARVNGSTVAHDSTLETSFRLKIDTVPTLIRVQEGAGMTSSHCPRRFGGLARFANG